MIDNGSGVVVTSKRSSMLSTHTPEEPTRPIPTLTNPAKTNYICVGELYLILQSKVIAITLFVCLSVYLFICFLCVRYSLFPTFPNFFPTFSHFSPLFLTFKTFHTFLYFFPLFHTFRHFSTLLGTFRHFSPLFPIFPYFPYFSLLLPT